MTLPDERTRAIHAARELLLDLLNPAATPRVPRAVRKRAGSVLRHYPWPADMHTPKAFDWMLPYERPVSTPLRLNDFPPNHGPGRPYPEDS